MLKEDKEELLKLIEKAIDENPYGAIRVEMRGPNSNVDLVVEKRTRFKGNDKPIKKNKNYNNG